MKHTQREKEEGQMDFAAQISRYTDWRPNPLHGGSTAVFVGSRTVVSLLPPAATEKGFGGRVFCHSAHTHTHWPLAGCRFGPPVSTKRNREAITDVPRSRGADTLSGPG